MIKNVYRVMLAVVVAIAVIGLTGCSKKSGADADGIRRITSEALSEEKATFADIVVKINVPVEWTIDLTNSTKVGCRWGMKAIEEIGFPGFATHVPATKDTRDDPAYANDIFQPGKKYVINFTPTAVGEYQLTCVEMGMDICEIYVTQ